jgi:hypothetical protein
VTFAEHMDQAAAQYLRECLDRAGGNVTQAAKASGTYRTHFHKRCVRYGVLPALHRPRSLTSLAPSLRAWPRPAALTGVST